MFYFLRGLVFYTSFIFARYTWQATAALARADICRVTDSEQRTLWADCSIAADREGIFLIRSANEE